MKDEIKYIKQLTVIILLLWFLQTDCISQGTDMGLERKPGAFVGFSAGSIKSQIINNGDSEITQGEATGAFAGSLDAGYYFSKYFGLKTGIGFSSYETELTLESYTNDLMVKDSENETYELRVTASDISELQKISVMNIPLHLVLNIPLSPAISIFAEPGLNILIPVNKSFSSSGIFTYKGYYPEYNVLMENLPTHGFSNNTTIKTEDDLEIKKVWADLNICAGIDLALNRKFHLAAAYCYSKSVSDISGYESPDEFQLSSSSGQVNSLMGGSEKVSTKAMGFSISLKYFINR